MLTGYGVRLCNGPVMVKNGGYCFTWLDKHASKMSKLYWFLVSDGLSDLFPNFSGLILHLHISDHKSIIFKESHMDYGPTPFCLFCSWFLEQDFTSFVEDSWNNDGGHASNVMILLKNKLKSLKQTLKTLSIQKKSIREHDRRVLLDYLLKINLRLDKEEGLPDDLPNRSKIFHDIIVMDHKIYVDMPQKAKVKWAIEGDADSNFFHSIVNKKRRQQAIKGILVDEE
uniref:RNA-directed DNA polymerase, eukaryota, reverse transcriptase zinc-binding domain protein n=1 Tax=Tanacetum cinerariifolium TaxID=118510 RepID=A0A699HK23_TANCI|nr:RNA-directed DNA polymerase, eukaryota, reverse transcriptase zinc-binding domain protein [Tanacetum cinerariifolium]